MRPWIEWEDYQAGMYSLTADPSTIGKCAALLRDPGAFEEAAREMIREWPNAALHNIGRMWSGRNAWVGQATCSYVHGATSATTRQAWGTLTNTEQRRANDIATGVRAEWERRCRDAQTTLAL